MTDKITKFENTSGTLELTLKPKQTERDSTDLRFYGTGATRWGEGANQNFIRLLENFAVSSKEEDGKIYPKNEDDLNQKGLGVNNPITGQLWYDTDTQTLFIFDEEIVDDDNSGWQRVTGSTPSGDTAPSTPQTGNLWFDTSEEQLKVWNGDEWISVAKQYVRLDGTNAMEGDLDLGDHRIVNLATPNDDQDASTKKYVDDWIEEITDNGLLDDLYINRDGDTVTGEITFDTTEGSKITFEYSDSTLVIGEGDSTSAGSDITKDGSMLISADGDASIHFTDGNKFTITRGGDNRDGGFTDMLTVDSDGLINTRSSYAKLSLSPESIVNKEILDDTLPPGIIIMWSGSLSSLPSTWSLCDGDNETPDLRDRFILGASGSSDIGDTGGEEEVKLKGDELPGTVSPGSTNSAGEHSHSGNTSTSGAHNHDDPGTSTDGSHSHSYDTSSNGSHTHDLEQGGSGPNLVWVDDAGTGHNNMPPYYKLAFIMYTP